MPTTRPTLLYRPSDAWVGDVIPFHGNGAFHVFYLWDDRDALGAWRGLDWAHLVTRDFVHFEELPLAVPRGVGDDLDVICGTGCVTPDPDGGWTIHYAGINPANPQRGYPEQVVLRTTSPDLVTWTKDPDWVFQADPRWYEANDWRDPFIYPDGTGGWKMLLCARVKDGPTDRRGTFAVATSPDMKHWTAGPPAFTPGTTRAPECPDLFAVGDRWYLVYAGFSDRFATRYLVADDADGPWRTPVHDALEAPDVYAMKTAADGDARYLMGWLSTRSGDRDTGHRQWGGDLIVHRIVVRGDGTLGAAPVDALIDRFELQPAAAAPRYGRWDVMTDGYRFDGSGLGYLRLGALGSIALIDVTLELSGDPDEVAVALRADADLERSYNLRLEPRRGRVVFDRRPHHISIPFDEASDRAYVDAPDHEIERPLTIPPDGRVRIRVIIDGSAIVAYVNDVALSTRGYDLPDGEWGVLAVGGRVDVMAPRTGRM